MVQEATPGRGVLVGGAVGLGVRVGTNVAVGRRSAVCCASGDGATDCGVGVNVAAGGEGVGVMAGAPQALTTSRAIPRIPAHRDLRNLCFQQECLACLRKARVPLALHERVAEHSSGKVLLCGRPLHVDISILFYATLG